MSIGLEIRNWLRRPAHPSRFRRGDLITISGGVVIGIDPHGGEHFLRLTGSITCAIVDRSWEKCQTWYYHGSLINKADHRAILAANPIDHERSPHYSKSVLAAQFDPGRLLFTEHHAEPKRPNS